MHELISEGKSIYRKIEADNQSMLAIVLLLHCPPTRQKSLDTSIPARKAPFTSPAYGPLLEMAVLPG
jgi:hypothetical protein